MAKKIIKWFIDKLLPILISIVLTGIMTISITNYMDTLKQKEKLRIISREVAQEMVDLQTKVNQLHKFEGQDFFALELVYNNSFIDNRMLLTRILSNDEINTLSSLYAQAEVMDEIMKIHINAKLSNNNELEISTKQKYLQEISSDKFLQRLKDIPTITDKIIKYLNK